MADWILYEPTKCMAEPLDTNATYTLLHESGVFIEGCTTNGYSFKKDNIYYTFCEIVKYKKNE